MGTATTLASLSFTQNADNNEASYGEDLLGMISVAQTKTLELTNTLTQIVNRLPNGDPNIATINTLIANLS